MKVHQLQCKHKVDSLQEKLWNRRYPQLATAMAVFSGSLGSGGGGFLLVLTAQNLQPRVHVSPRTMIVAVAIPSPPPFQHCYVNSKKKTHIILHLQC